MVDGVASARDTTRGSIASLARLEGSARRIEKLVEAIGLVAMQTTMLAVSGSVEAARAGAAGRGFSLVSKDIRTLARQAAEAIDNAKDRVRDALGYVTTLQRELDIAADVADREVEKSVAVITTLAQLDGEVDLMRRANDDIVQGAEAILSATKQMADASRQIAASAEESGNAARQAATAASQQAHGAEDLAAAIEEVATLAETIKQQNA